MIFALKLLLKLFSKLLSRVCSLLCLLDLFSPSFFTNQFLLAKLLYRLLHFNDLLRRRAFLHHLAKIYNGVLFRELIDLLLSVVMHGREGGVHGFMFF